MRVVLVLLALCCLATCSLALTIRQKAHQDPKSNSPGIQFQKVVRQYNGFPTNGFLFNLSNAPRFFHVYASCDELSGTDAQAQAHGCELAMNGGPFSFTAPHCLGYIVSDGKIVVDPGAGTASMNFGYDGRTGEWVMGELSSYQVRNMNFTQLVTGFDFLVVNGKPQPPAGGEIAPRTMVGADKDGNLMMFEVDGVEKQLKGLTLQQAAAWFIDLGVYNAVNLDGGGSSATWYQGSIIDFPTCSDVDTFCVRPVATTLCIKSTA